MWRVFGYTLAALADMGPNEIGGYDRDDPLRVVEMVAHMLASDAYLIVVQRSQD